MIELLADTLKRNFPKQVHTHLRHLIKSKIFTMSNMFIAPSLASKLHF